MASLHVTIYEVLVIYFNLHVNSVLIEFCSTLFCCDLLLSTVSRVMGNSPKLGTVAELGKIDSNRFAPTSDESNG